MGRVQAAQSIGMVLHELATSESQMADIKCERAPLLVRGRVVVAVPGETELGKVSISVPERLSHGTIFVTSSVDCTPAGAFELFGWALDGPLHIQASLLGRVVGSIEVAKGETNAKLELRN